jgi:hypothetical protein
MSMYSCDFFRIRWQILDIYTVAYAGGGANELKPPPIDGIIIFVFKSTNDLI